MKKLSFPLIASLAMGAMLNSAQGNMFWDPTGTTVNATGNGTFENAAWTTSGTPATPGSFVDGSFTVFSVTGEGATAVTCTVNSDHTIAGIFNGGTGGATTCAALTLTGPGKLKFSGAQGFSTSSGGNSTYNLVLADGAGGPGILQNGSSGQIFLNGVNTFSGGVNVAATGLINFNNSQSFGTGPINWNTGGSGGAFVVEGTSAVIIPNNFVVNAAYSYNFVGNANGVTYSGNWTLGANTISLGSGGATGNLNILSGVISGSGGVGRQSQSPAGIIQLTGANTYTGPSSIQSGTTKVSSINSVSTPAQQASSNLGKPSSAANGILAFGATANPGILVYTGVGETTDRVINLAGTTGGATIQNDGSGALTFTGVNTATGVGAKTLTLTGSSTAGGKIGKIVDSSSGATGITKAGAGTWTLTGANTHTGATALSGTGLLNIGNAAALSTGTFVVGGNGSFDNTTGSDLTVANAFTLSGGSPTYVGSANNMTINGPVAMSVANRTVTVSARTLTLGGVVSGAFSFAKAGAGTLVLNNANTYTGATSVTGGVLNFANASALPSGSTLTVNAGSFDNTTGSDLTVANPFTLTGAATYVGSANNMTINGAVTMSGGNRALTVSGNTLTLGGALGQDSGSRQFTKAGNGTLVLNAVATYLGNTVVTAGTLSIGVANALPSGTTLNMNGGTLDLPNNATVNALQFSGSAKVAGTWGSSTSGADHQDSRFTGSGILTVTTGGTSTTTVTSDVNPAGQGQTVTLTVTVTGTGSSSTPSGSVTIFDNGSPIATPALSGSGAIATATLSTSTLSLGDHPITATWNGDDSFAPSSSSTLTQNIFSQPAAIVSSPSSSTVDAGSTVVLTVAANGFPVPSFQWKRGGNNLVDGAFDNAATVSGSSTASLTLTSVRAVDASVYTCAITNSTGDDASAPVTLGVNDPVITVQPVDSTFNCGSSNALTVTAVGTTNADGVLLYQWYSPDPSGTVITDATNATLSFPTVSFANAGSYSVVITNALGNSITSSVVVVTVQDTNAPVITVNPGTDIVECHTSFTDAGATANDGCDGSVIVTTTGSVDANTVNIYTLTYSATDSHGNSSTATRVVTVHDTTAPTISLNGLAELTVSCGTPYSDAGATASDSCAGDLTSQMSVNLGGLNAANPTGGDYTIIYNVQDPAGNAATTVTRLVHVIDNVPPVITVAGANPATVECHGAYTDAGATASDTCAGVLTPITSGTVDANTVGNYTLTYSATDGVNTSTATRVVNVIDTTAPVITLNSDAAVTNECHTSYSDPGASASDACDAGASVALSGTVDLNTVGVYTRTYTATDASGNHSSTTRQITVADTIAPVITVTGNNPATVECHTSYTDAGATATDACDAAPNVTSSGTVDANTAGTYTITYNSQDAAGNTSSATRVVAVQDTTAPTISLNGLAELTISCGTPYSDAGATANDSCAGDLTSQISVNLGGLTLANPTGGDYTITYNVQDPAGNAATTVTRLVHVVDTTAPVITVTGANTLTVECHSTYTDAGATANDNCAGIVTPTTSGTVDANTVGTYTLTYAATDGVNTSTATRVVTVTDSTAPVITLTGAAAATVECHGSFSDPGASASDDCDANASVVTSGTVDLNTIGVYTRTYTASDASGNHSSTTRQITVNDTTAPVVTVTGSNPTTVECHTSYTDAGATVSDVCDTNASVSSSGSVDPNTVGSYTISYSSTDASGNNSTATRVVNVTDTTAPVVTLNGAAFVTVECHGSFSDPGATAVDACDANASVTISGAADANTPGVYTVTYSSTDAAGNTGSATRTVTVSDTSAPVVSLNGSASMNVECHSSFTDPGASANDACEGSVNVTTSGSVDANTLGNYTLTYSACDSSGDCVTVSRLVHVVDTAAPTVTLNGTSPINIECHGSFTDPGATSADNCDAGTSVVTTGSVDANTAGSYTLTYTSTDANGNSNSATRVVNVTDATAPTVTATGGDQTIECHGSFTDAGATANDACSGDLTANISVSGSVDTNNVGVYTLTYSVSDASGNNGTATRTITVKDTTAPVITVTGGTNASACLFSTYTDAGATANDACTGDLTANIIVTGNVDTNMAGDYTLTYSVSDVSGNSATVTRVVTVAACNAVITQQPQDTNVNANSPLTLNVTVVSGNPIAYQWKKEGTNIVGATSSNYTVANAFRADAGVYAVDVTSGANTITSSNATVTVSDPVFTINPASATVAVGVEKTVTLLSGAQGTPALKYQWYVQTAAKTKKLGTLSANSNLVVTVSLAAAGSYYCVVTNVGKGITATSQSATLVVYQKPGVSAPANVTKFVGQSATLKVTASPAQANMPQYGGPVHYQWVLGTSNSYTPLVESAHYVGTTGAVLNIVDAQTSDAGSYSCYVFNNVLSNATPLNVFSKAAILTVKAYTNPPVVVIVKPGSNASTNVSQIDVYGTATDKGFLTGVSLSQTTLNGTTNMPSDITYKTNATHQQVTGKVTWTNTVTLVPGTNAFTASAMDSAGNVGTNKPVRNVFYLVSQQLTVQTNGVKVSGSTAGMLGKPIVGTANVYQGIGYTLKAIPPSGHGVLWTDGNGNPFTGDVGVDSATTMHFIMPGTNLTIRANVN